MAINWNEYELVLEDSSSKECEVTGREMGGTTENTCPVSTLMSGDGHPRWSNNYGGYGSVRVIFLRTDDEAIHLRIHNGYDFEKSLKPGEEWSSGWYDFGSWSYHVKLYLRKIEK